MAKTETDVLVDELTGRLAVAKIETLAYTLTNLKRKALLHTVAVRLAKV